MEGWELKAAELFQAGLCKGGADAPSSPALTELLCSSRVCACCVAPLSQASPALPALLIISGVRSMIVVNWKPHSPSPVFWCCLLAQVG